MDTHSWPPEQKLSNLKTEGYQQMDIFQLIVIITSVLVLQYTSYSLQTQGTQLATSEILKHPSSAFRRGGTEFDLHSIYYSFYVHEHLVKKSLWIIVGCYTARGI